MYIVTAYEALGTAIVHVSYRDDLVVGGGAVFAGSRELQLSGPLCPDWELLDRTADALRAIALDARKAWDHREGWTR
jgi:hypothetical protein